MPDGVQGFYDKYEVEKGGDRVEDCFVLEPTDDPAARAALASYADTTGNDELAVDLAEWLTEIAPSERRYGLGPDTRPIDDLTATEECNSCGWSPAAVILTEGNWECYNCGFDPDANDGLETDGGVEGHFHSGDHHVLYDDHTPEQQRSPEDSCIECGCEAFNHRCGCCGFPLCSKHRELGAGFCSKFLTVGGVPVCVYDYDTYVGTHMRRDPEPKVLLAATEDTDVYHLPDEEGESAPLCRPKEDGKLEVSLSLVADTDHELCSLCEEHAAKELADRKQIDGGEV